MKTPKELSESLRRAGELATKVSTCRRLAGGITAMEFEFLGLTEKERETLNKARALLNEVAMVYDKAAKLKKRAEALRAQREKDVRAAMKGTFDQLATTADKVALIAANRAYTFGSGGVGADLTRRRDAEYLLGEIFKDSLDSIAHDIEADSTLKQLAPAAAVAQGWQRFTERRAALQDRFAQVIVRVDRLLAGEEVTCS
jgi:hypothetical protein